MKKYKINVKRFTRSLALTVTVVSALTWTSISAVSALSDEEVARVEQQVVVVRGDTLWSIAKKYKTENQDIREYVTEVKQLNGLSDANIRVGQVLTLKVVERSE